MTYGNNGNNVNLTVAPTQQSRYQRLKDMSTQDLEAMVFDNGNGNVGKMEGLMEEAMRIRQDYSSIGNDYSGYFGRFRELLDRWGITNPNQRLRGVAKKAGSMHKHLEKIIEVNQQRSGQLSKEVQKQKDKQSYAEVLMKRYEIMMGQNNGRIDSLTVELETAKRAAIEDPENMAYQDVEAQVHELEYDNEEIGRKYRAAANVVIKTDARITALQGKKALSDKGARKAEGSHLTAGLLIDKLTDYTNAENVSPKDVVSAIADVEGINKELREQVNQLDTLTERALSIYDRIPGYQGEPDESDKIRERIRQGNALDEDKIVDRAKRILEKKRAVA